MRSKVRGFDGMCCVNARCECWRQPKNRIFVSNQRVLLYYVAAERDPSKRRVKPAPQAFLDTGHVDDSSSDDSDYAVAPGRDVYQFFFSSTTPECVDMTWSMWYDYLLLAVLEYRFLNTQTWTFFSTNCDFGVPSSCQV
jgi:hypothetical protein